MADIFLSYASPDRAKAKSLDAFLKARSYSVFWDRESIPIGWTFDDFIDKELRDAKAVIVLWSKFAAASRWVRIEAKEALERGILVPAVLEKIEQQTIPLEFRRIHSADLSTWDFCNVNLEVDRLLEAVDKLVGKKPATEKSPNLGTKDISAVQVQDSDLNSSDHPPALDTKSLSRMSLAPSTNVEQSHRINTSENQHKVRIKIISFAMISLIVGGGGIWYFWRSPVGLPKSNQEEQGQPPQSATNQKSAMEQGPVESEPLKPSAAITLESNVESRKISEKLLENPANQLQVVDPRQQEVASLLSQAKKLFDQNALEASLAEIEKGLEIESNNTDLLALRNQVYKKLDEELQKTDLGRFISQLEKGTYVVIVNTFDREEAASEYVNQMKSQYPQLFYPYVRVEYNDDNIYGDVNGHDVVFIGGLYSEASAKKLRSKAITLGFRKDSFIFEPWESWRSQ